MAMISELSHEDVDFLRPYLPPPIQQQRQATEAIGSRPNDHGAAAPSSEQGNDASGSTSSRPFVTLTYAQSVDGMISLAPGTRTVLSGLETKTMTHYLRLKHEAILIGVGTAIADDPSLNCRYPGARFTDQPKPFILDPNQRWDKLNSKVKALADREEGKRPILIHPPPKTDPDTLIATPHDWNDILLNMKKDGIQSVMIEGGATVINSLLMEPELVDSVIVTIAPTWLGRGGVSVSPPATADSNGTRVNAARLENVSWRQFGQDSVMCGRLVP